MEGGRNFLPTFAMVSTKRKGKQFEVWLIRRTDGCWLGYTVRRSYLAAQRQAKHDRRIYPQYRVRIVRVQGGS